MGVNLRDLFPQHEVPSDWYEGKRIAVDGHNVAFRYLTSIRARDGDVLRNADGRATSHLYGFLGLVKNLREAGAEPIVIWDGDVHPRKEATVQERIRKRQEAVEKMEAAKAAGDHAAFQRYARMTTYLDADMIRDCSRLLESVGVAVTRADYDGERYGAGLCAAGHADAVATEDFDALVAGAPEVLRKAGGQQPFMHHLRDLEDNALSLEQLRHIAILCGTDWHPGVKGFGAKTAMKALQDIDAPTLIAEAHSGVTATRYHKLVAKSDMTLDVFTELDTYIATLPSPDAPRAPKGCPEMATAVADELGMGHERVLACFC